MYGTFSRPYFKRNEVFTNGGVCNFGEVELRLILCHLVHVPKQLSWTFGYFRKTGGEIGIAL